MPRNCTILPDCYSQMEKIDLQNHKRTALWVNILSLALFLAALIPFFCFTDVSSLINAALNNMGNKTFIAMAAMFAGLILYLSLHELTHGVFMRIFSKTGVKYGFSVLYAYAGSTAYFNKRSYIIIALAPVVIWGIIFAVLTLSTYASYRTCFCIFYILGAFNLSGSAGDLYMAVKTGRMDNGILIRDSGTEMVVFGTAEKYRSPN